MVSRVHFATEQTIAFLAVLTGYMVAFIKFKSRTAAFRTELHMFELREISILGFNGLRTTEIFLIIHPSFTSRTEIETTTRTLNADVQIDLESGSNRVRELNQI